MKLDLSFNFFHFIQIHNVFAQSCQVQLLGLRVGKRVAQVQFMVMELQQKNIALAMIMNFHGGQDAVDGNGIRIWAKIVAFQVIIYKESLPEFLFCTIYTYSLLLILWIWYQIKSVAFTNCTLKPILGSEDSITFPLIIFEKIIRIAAQCLQASKGKILQTYDHWGKTFKIVFDIKVDEAASDPLVNIFHFTKGEKCCEKGERIPALWIQRDHFLIGTAIDNDGNKFWTYAFNYGQKYHLEISQDANGLFRVLMDGQLKTEIQNSQPQDYDNVKVYFSNPWDSEFHGCVENFQVSKGM